MPALAIRSQKAKLTQRHVCLEGWVSGGRCRLDSNWWVWGARSCDSVHKGREERVEICSVISSFFLIASQCTASSSLCVTVTAPRPLCGAPSAGSPLTEPGRRRGVVFSGSNQGVISPTSRKKCLAYGERWL